MYKNAFNDINSWNIKNGIEGIKNLLLLWSTLAFAGWKLNKEHMQKAKWLIEKKYIERIKQIEKDIVKLNEEIKENKAKQKENTEKINDLQKEKIEIESWELFQKAWKIDKSSENIEKKDKS
jgi:septal ring factor EnvC (AmiA/AmiB activator)